VGGGTGKLWANRRRRLMTREQEGCREINKEAKRTTKHKFKIILFLPLCGGNITV
jgi:hypothetical protein